MIVFSNCFDVEVPKQINLQIYQPDDEGWRKYQMSLIMNSQGHTLVNFEHSFNEMCIERLKNGLNNLITRKINQFDFEPIEPAFRLKIAANNQNEFEMLCIVDVNYVQGGVATETGLGMLILVSVEELKMALQEIS